MVGGKVAARVSTDKRVGDKNREYGRVRATSFEILVGTANRRLFKLKDVLNKRYEYLPTDETLSRVLPPEQPDLGI